MESHSCGILKAIAHRPTDGRPMTEAREVNVQAGRGIDLENRKSGKREITLLSAEAWAETCRTLGKDLPWHLRRANLLIEGFDLARAIGRELTVGPVRIHIHGETKPCNVMESQQAGLREALVPHCRGGVYGQVLQGGLIRVGDRVEFVDPRLGAA